MLDAIIPFYKPKGVTSHDCVIQLRKLTGIKKVGHTGTLDPDVEGVLPICIGKATKLAEYITDFNKQYEAHVTLGFSTTTEDASGVVVEEKKVTEQLSEESIKQVLTRFQGRQIQTPPMYSAVKVAGKRLYEYAREGITIERPTRSIDIFDITMMPGSLHRHSDAASFTITVTCSKGTYVRTLAVDIGHFLGYPAHMSFLKRTRSGPFTIEECYTFEQLQNYKKANKLEKTGFSIERVLQHFPQIPVSSDTAKKIKNGMVLESWDEIRTSPFVVTHEGKALALYQHHPDKAGLIKPKTMLYTN